LGGGVKEPYIQIYEAVRAFQALQSHAGGGGGGGGIPCTEKTTNKEMNVALS
jgi:hypothetical protein